MKRFFMILMMIPLLLLAGCGKTEDPLPAPAVQQNTGTQPEEVSQPVAEKTALEPTASVAVDAVQEPMETIDTKSAATEDLVSPEVITVPEMSSSIQQDAEGNAVYTVTLDKLPASLQQLQAMPESTLSEPQYTAALTVAVLCQYPVNQEACLEMLAFLQGPREITPYDRQFLADRFRDGKDYVPRSYFAGAVPENDYTPDEPYTIIFFENPYSRTNISDGYLTLHVNSGGADSSRQISLRNKPSTGEWFLWEQFVLVDIRKPVSEDPWA